MKKYSSYFEPSLKDARKRLHKDTAIINFHMEPRYFDLGKNKKYLIKTYGCQANIADSERIAGLLEAMGYSEVFEDDKSDLILFNTCAIRENAEDRVFGEVGRIKSLKKTNPNLLIGICGCMPQEEKTIKTIKEKHPEVDLVFGTHNIFRLPEYLYEIKEKSEKVFEVFSYEGDIVEDMPVKRDHNKKAWVNITFGCDEFCTYCIVPYTRGKERSRSPEHIINEVKELASNGYKEVTLLGQNVNSYGKDLNIGYTFANLLSDLQKTDIERVRFTTSHPKDLDLATIEVMGRRGNTMPHLHLPVQSGSNTVLKKMNRKYTKEDYINLITALKNAVPDIAITTDIIVGFPTETEEDYLKTLELVKEVGFEGAYTFIYSKREGTPAAKYEDDTPADVKKTRLLNLNKLINEGFLKGNKRFEGKIVKVLVDGESAKNDEMLTGYSEHNKLVNFKGDSSLIGSIVNVKIDKAYTWHLRGTIVK
ncbi:MAG: tRNA (N6-isopentenyl adenosine(37)-C2)-methylthiotransferase MiaB [Bacilli bacterium]|jgi:tRNA-2-methylthio-N6-dimethylallyladenosine synthase